MLVSLNTRSIIIDKKLAAKIGLNETVVLDRIYRWLETNRIQRKNYYHGRYWTYNSLKRWNYEFPFWDVHTLKEIFENLRDMGLIIIGDFNMVEGSPIWYTIDYGKLEEMWE